MAHFFRWMILWLLPDFLKGAQMARKDIEDAFEEGVEPEEVLQVALRKRLKISAEESPKAKPRVNGRQRERISQI